MLFIDILYLYLGSIWGFSHALKESRSSVNSAHFYGKFKVFKHGNQRQARSH